MNKQILVLSASFRKGGNSDTLCDQFIKGAVEAGNRVEKIYLNDCKITFAAAVEFVIPLTNAYNTTIWPKYWTRWLKPTLS